MKIKVILEKEEVQLAIKNYLKNKFDVTSNGCGQMTFHNDDGIFKYVEVTCQEKNGLIDYIGDGLKD